MKRTVNVSERVRKVSMEGECATVGVLHTAASGTVQDAANPCSFGLSPEFSTPVEKPVENRPNERLGADSRPYRNKGEPSLVLHVVPAHVVHRRRSRFDRRPCPERGLHGLAHEALLGRDGGGDGGSETSERHRPVRSRFERRRRGDSFER